jgi:glycosyltransferase involved in cell wall biosynthesis
MALISVITINYNNAEGLKKTIDSVIGQTFKDLEFIIIDGGSTDKSIEIIKQSTGISSWVSEKDNGIYHAQNKGIAKATGEYLLFLNSGDILAENNTLEKVAPYLSKSDIVYGDLITEDGKGVRKQETSPEALDVYHFMISTLWHPCTFIHTSVFKRFGNYNEEFKITADYEFFIRAVLKHGVSYKHIPVFICVFDLKGVSNDSGNDKLQTEERKKSWLANFSPAAMSSFEEHTKLLRSGEYAIGKKIKNLKNLFGKK